MPLREPRCTVKNRVRELRSPGTVRDEGSNVLVYSEVPLDATALANFDVRSALGTDDRVELTFTAQA
jgi:hypothetical protein